MKYRYSNTVSGQTINSDEPREDLESLARWESVDPDGESHTGDNVVDNSGILAENEVGAGVVISHPNTEEFKDAPEGGSESAPAEPDVTGDGSVVSHPNTEEKFEDAPVAPDVQVLQRPSRDDKKPVWVEFAKALELDVPEGSTKDDIMEAVKASGK